MGKSIAVVCANGRAGRATVAEALSRDHKVTAFARDKNRSDAADYDNTDYPARFRPLAMAKLEAYQELEQNPNVRWTYLCPPADFRPDGERTGRHRLTEGLVPLGRDEAPAAISYADFACALVDLSEHGGHDGSCLCVTWE